MRRRKGLLDKGKEKLNHDLEVSKFINMVHSHDVFMQVLFEDWERIFLNFQQRKVIKSDSDENEDDLEEGLVDDNKLAFDFI